MHDLSMDYAPISYPGKYPAVLTINCSRNRHFCYILCQPYLSTIVETPIIGDDFRMGTGKIVAYATAALLFIILVVVTVPVVSGDTPRGGAGAAPAGNVSAGTTGIGNVTSAGNVSVKPGMAGASSTNTGGAPGVTVPGTGGPGFDSWGWGGLGPNGILAPGAGGCTRPGKASGALWSYWQPGPF
jgi:hypothetical protein